MTLRILCSGHLIRYPLGGFTWHHLQYLLGFERLGHEVTYFEHFGWPDSCYDPAQNAMTADPSYGINYLVHVLARYDLAERWCYLGQDGTAYGMSRDELRRACRECDVYFNISNINWIPELEDCRRRVLIDTDPVFTQIGGHGVDVPFNRYDALFTFGENVHEGESTMPTAGAVWGPTRQPIVLDQWSPTPGNRSGFLTSVMNWSAYGDREQDGRVYGQKDREFEPFFTLPHDTGERMELAAGAAPADVLERLRTGGWRLADALAVSLDPWSYQRYLRSSRGEFCVAKHAYVSTRSGWFSERSAGYLASGRPVVVQDTGFSDFLPCGEGLQVFSNRSQALAALNRLTEDYELHCHAARALAEKYFDSDRVLTDLLERSVGVNRSNQVGRDHSSSSPRS